MPISLSGLLDEDDEFSELVSPNTPRADLVKAPANGADSWLVMKQDAAGLLDPEFVQELAARSGQGEKERAVMANGITVSGSPADIASFIHKAAQRDRERDASKEAGVPDTVTKADVNPDLDDGRDGLDTAVPLAEPDEMGSGSPTDPGSPAWESVDAATACKWTSILARSKVAVGMLAERELLEAAAGDDGDMCNAMDLQDACCAIDYVIGVLAPFAVAEQSEADCGDMAMAKSAASPEVVTAVRKAMEAADLSMPLQQLEFFGAVAKSGRVLSSVNEAHIREAATRLNTVLQSLPQAPIDDGQPVAKSKETTVDGTETAPAGALSDEAKAVLNGAPPAQVTKAAGDNQGRDAGPVADAQVPGMGTIPGRPQNETMDTPSGRKVLKAAVYDQGRSLLGLVDPARIAQAVAKADGDGKVTMQAVFNEDGELVGIVDPADITPVAGAGGSGGADPDGDGTQAAMPATDAADMTPAPAAETGTPAATVPDDGTVAKQDGTEDVLKALKSTFREVVAEMLGSQEPAEGIAKQADVAGILTEVETLKARLAQVEEQPAAPKVFTNGAVPPAHQLRGQDQGGPSSVTVAKAKELKETLYRGTAPQQQEAFLEMQGAAIDGLAALHANRQR